MSIHIRDVEKRLFRYLFLNKVATSSQISRDVWEDTISHQAMYKRLNLLLKCHYLEANYHKELGGRLVYSLSGKAMKDFGLIQTRLQRNQLKSDSILHDLVLVNIKYCIEQFNGLQEYYTENAIRSGIELPDDDILLALKKFNFDAILKMKRQDQIHFLPIEFERSLKFDSRYKLYFKKLYSEDQIKAILFIGQSQKILSHVQNMETKCLNGCWPKTFYILLDDLLNANESVEFLNLNQERITFTRLQGLSCLQPETQTQNDL